MTTPNMWCCATCAKALGTAEFYPPSPDVYCARCGARLDPVDRTAAVLRAILDQLQSPEGTGTRSAAEPAKSAPDLMTVKEVAEYLRISPSAAYSRIDRGQVPGVVKDCRKVRVRRRDLLRYVRENSVPSPGEP
jgi:excisionase family DNA binding protein